MEKATGIGGLFIRSEDPARLARWYREALGIDTYSEEQDGVWRQEAGPTVWSPFPQDTDYFGRRSQGFMVNVRVRDLDAMLAQVRATGATVIDDVQEMEGLGRFGWVEDPDGNRIELWQPAPETLNPPA
jgi:predicted enzyme related to lactoylglutathione lyase